MSSASSPEVIPSQAAANRAWAETLLGALAALGLRDLVASPGARSTPLLLAAKSHPDLRLRLITDERVASFVALGIARGTGRAVALLSTSGSAGAHWLPALVEARASRIGLLALTANRPHELQDCGAPQAVPQGHFFGDQVGFTRALPAPGPAPASVELRALETLALTAWGVASGPDALPVHLDLAFRAPLWSADSEQPARSARSASPATPPAPPAARQGPPRHVVGVRRLARPALAGLAQALSAHPRGVVVCGPDAGGPSPRAAAELAPALVALAEALGWPLICDAASGLRGHVSRAITSGEALARWTGAPASLQPEAVLRFGGAPVHKSLASLCARAPQQWVVDGAGRSLDPTHSAEVFVHAAPADLAADLSSLVSSADASWRARWLRAEELAQRALRPLLDEETLWGGGVAATLAAALPEGGVLHVASSLAIRDVDAFAPGGRSLTLSCNRGANGIDGTLSTAWGLALGLGLPVFVLSGDLAFLHDLGGLAALEGATLRVLVVDNGGGGIFSYLPIAQNQDAFEPCFLTPPDADLLALARATGAKASEVHTRSELQAALATPAHGLEVIVARVERARCEDLHRQAWASVGAALTAGRLGEPPATNDPAARGAHLEPEQVRA